MSSAMSHHVALLKTDILEDHMPSIFRMKKISQLRGMLAVTSNCR
jgi:hypothetical protein